MQHWQEVVRKQTLNSPQRLSTAEGADDIQAAAIVTADWCHLAIQSEAGACLFG